MCASSAAKWLHRATNGDGRYWARTSALLLVRRVPMWTPGHRRGLLSQSDRTHKAQIPRQLSGLLTNCSPKVRHGCVNEPMCYSHARVCTHQCRYRGVATPCSRRTIEPTPGLELGTLHYE